MSESRQAPFPLEIDVETLSAMRVAEIPPLVLDVREPWETDLCQIDGSLSVPLGTLPERIGDLPGDRPIAVLCHYGARSARAAHWLRGHGFDQATNVAGGIDAWAISIDPTMRRY
ncbi:MAG: rhodanese-like domain-containing protein [Inquilinaceae bacterium]